MFLQFFWQLEIFYLQQEKYLNQIITKRVFQAENQEFISRTFIYQIFYFYYFDKENELLTSNLK